MRDKYWHISFVLLLMGYITFGSSYAQEVAQSTVQDAPPESLFYSRAEVEKIYQAFATYKNRGDSPSLQQNFNEEEFFSQVGEIKQARSEDRYFVYPQFFLESLVFRSDSDWAIWLSGQHITSESKRDNSDIRVLGIDNQQVTLEWKPSNFDRVMKTWANAPHDTASVDEKHRLVTFSLKPNQTFSSYVMRVLEGKVLPVTVDNQALEKEFESKEVVLDKPGETLQDIYSDVPELEKQGASPSENTQAVQQNPSEVIGVYGAGEKKEDDSSTPKN